MRVVIDTNVFVSAALKDRSLPAIALRLAYDHGTLLMSVATERQLIDVLARPYLVSVIVPEARAWISEVLAGAEAVTISETVELCRDPTDDKFLELAFNGHADVIVTGDADLLVLNPFRTIPILSPSAFVQNFGQPSP
jgi:putative PIN family toxin of toxin-antitoxin system